MVTKTHLAFGGIGLLAGAGVLAVTLSLLSLLGLRQTPSGTGGDESPVNPRSGSFAIANVDAYSKVQDEIEHGFYIKNDNHINSTIYLYGVKPVIINGSSPPWKSDTHPIPNWLFENWKIDITDRGEDGHSPGEQVIELCSYAGTGSPPTPRCGQPSGHISWLQRSYSTYFYFPPWALTQDQYLDTQSNEGRWVFRLHDPNSGYCDRMDLITVTVGKRTGTYQCMNGLCSITIGGPER